MIHFKNIADAPQGKYGWVIEGRMPGRRLASNIWPLPKGGGVAFAETGWPEAWGGHPFHLLRGKITGPGPKLGPDGWEGEWTVETEDGPVTIRVLDYGDPLASYWNDWLRYRAGSPDRGAGLDALAARAAENSFDLPAGTLS